MSIVEVSVSRPHGFDTIVLAPFVVSLPDYRFPGLKGEWRTLQPRWRNDAVGAEAKERSQLSLSWSTAEMLHFQPASTDEEASYDE